MVQQEAAHSSKESLIREGNARCSGRYGMEFLVPRHYVVLKQRMNYLVATTSSKVREEENRPRFRDRNPKSPDSYNNGFFILILLYKSLRDASPSQRVPHTQCKLQDSSYKKQKSIMSLRLAANGQYVGTPQTKLSSYDAVAIATQCNQVFDSCIANMLSFFLIVHGVFVVN